MRWSLKYLSCLLFLGMSCLVYPQQQELKPSELEQAKLAKLKAQNDTYIQQLAQIETQMQALNILKQLTQTQQQQKYSEFLGLANKIKEDHKEWGDSKSITYTPQQGEYGVFTKKEEQKEKQVSK